MKTIIDVSTHQGTINWEQVKPQIDGVIIRCGFGMDMSEQDDKQFERNASECERLGIPYGVYLYSYATNDNKARSEAEHILRLVKGKKLSYPIYLDLEEEKDECRTYAPRACEVIGSIIEAAGYTFGIYANKNWWEHYLVGVDKYTKWVAQYNKTCTYKGNVDMWQYSSKGVITGISGNVDMNLCYFDEVNNTVEIKEESKVELKSTHEVALEVIAGKWDNGEARKKKLAAAGYNVSEVQNEVNVIMASRTNSNLYTVKKGDTLSAIAKKYNSTVSQIARNNGITNPNLIYPGQKLVI